MRIFILLMSVLLVMPADLLACTCEPPPPPCYAYGESDAVFIGEIKNISPNALNPGFLDKVEVGVIQSFKGMTYKTAYTHNSGHSCMWTFHKGQKLLFYVNTNDKDKNLFGAGLCSRTSRFDEGLSDFNFFKSLADTTPRYWIWGTTFRDWGGGPIQGIRAEVLDNKRKVIGVSDINGDLKISVSKEGKYKVRVFTPKGASLAFPQREEQRKILKATKLEARKPYLEYEVDVKTNQCGWFGTTLYGLEENK